MVENKQQKQIFNAVMKLPLRSSSMKLCNAYIDQFLMNWNYESGKFDDCVHSWILLKQMFEAFFSMRSR